MALANRKITPSKPDMWQGTPVEGSPWTAEQHRELKRERPDWTHFHTRRVRLESPTYYAWDAPEVVTVECPIIAWTKDRQRVLVITPAGFKQWMAAEQ